mmetsp:Transcript_6441/g.8145  ORF Transcript_6441/g.8145 Transcript_6441/m.8145 type:complete len:181 (-) Transcript_6441:553-1095(-)
MTEEQPPEVKAEAREFMKGLMSAPPSDEFVGGNGIDMAAWKFTYKAATSKDSALMEKFWSIYDPKSTSIWTMVYDEADSNENLDDTVEIVKDFMKKTESLNSHCFGVMHTLEGLEIEGLWVFNGPDPEQLFGANDDTSWYSWNQIGPEPNELVKKAAARYLAPTEGKLKGKLIKDSQIFC